MIDNNSSPERAVAALESKVAVARSSTTSRSAPRRARFTGWHDTQGSRIGRREQSPRA